MFGGLPSYHAVIHDETLAGTAFRANLETRSPQQSFHDPVVRAEFLDNMPGCLFSHIRKKVGKALETCFGRLAIGQLKYDIAQDELSAGFEHAADIAQGHQLPEVGQVMQRRAGNGRVKAVRNVLERAAGRD